MPTTVLKAIEPELPNRQGRRKFERTAKTQVECHCATCGRSLFLSRSTVRDVNFCGHACCAEWKKTRTGPLAGGWRSGTRTVDDGRVKILQHEHPCADNIGYVYRYHLVMERMIGRLMTPAEIVHHMDFDPTNDSPSNLMLFSSEADHQRFHGRLRGGINGR